MVLGTCLLLYPYICVLNDMYFSTSVLMTVAVKPAGGAVSLRQQTVLAATGGGLPGIAPDSGPE